MVALRGGRQVHPAKPVVAAAAVAAAFVAIGIGPASGADLPLKAPVRPVAPLEWMNAFTGFTASPHSVYGEAGAVFALNHNIDVDGWLVRIKGGVGHYSYNRAPGLVQGVTFESGEVMIGYQTFVGTTRLSGYVGPNFENHANNDPLAVVAGTRGGIKGQGEIYAPMNDRLYFFALGAYSSVFRNYYTQAKLGYHVTNSVAIGPEAQALGNQRFDNVRVGPFVAFDLTPQSQLILSGGYSWDERRNSLNNTSGAYGGFHLRGNF
jgi:hypothetical protein